jgi:hypothetical protein
MCLNKLHSEHDGRRGTIPASGQPPNQAEASLESAARGVAVVVAMVLTLVLGLATQGQAANLEVGFIDVTNNNSRVSCADNAVCDAAPAIGTIIFDLQVLGASAKGTAAARHR